MSEDQLEPEDTLDDRVEDDALEAGYSPPDEPRSPTIKGTTPREVAEGETVEDRLAQEEPQQDGAIGGSEPADDVGMTSPESAAEEAAVHTLDPDADPDLDPDLEDGLEDRSE